MISAALCVRSHVLMCHEYRRIKGERGAWQAEPWRFTLIIINTITKAFATSGVLFPLYRLNVCSSADIPPSACWHRKGVTPQTSDSCFFHRGKAGTDLSNPTQLWVFVQVLVGWINYFSPTTTLTQCCRHQEKNKQSWALQAGFFEFPKPLRGISGIPSAWWTGIKPAVLCTTGMIWIWIDLEWREEQK